MSAPPWDLTGLRERWIGKQTVYTAPEPIGRAAFRYFATAVGDRNPLYVDPEAARAAGHDDVIAPPTLVCESNQYMTRDRDDHGYIGHQWDLGLTGCRQIRGGHTYRFSRPVRPDDVITATWQITDIEEKESRRGPMLIVTSQVDYTSGDEHLATNVDTIIHQPIGGAA